MAPRKCSMLLLALAAAAMLTCREVHAVGCPFKFLSGLYGSKPDHDHLMNKPAIQVEPSIPDFVPELSASPSRALLAKMAAQIDYQAVAADIKALLTDSQDWWPADFGNYGPFFVRMTWHCAGSYRSWDGRGGCDGGRLRFEPELSWDDNTNLNKALQLLQPIKIKYGPGLSWGDLIVFTGTVAIQSMGGPVLGFCAGRMDDTDGSASVALTSSTLQQALTPCPVNGNCSAPMGQTTLGLIYVNPHGHLGDLNPEGDTVNDIRGTFGRMGMNDSETVALIGAHAFGKTHGACPTGPGPKPSQDPYNPYPGTCGTGLDKGKGANTYTSGFEGPWTDTPTEWGNSYFKNLLDFDWELTQSPAGDGQWKPKAKAGSTRRVPDIMMLTTDISLIRDPAYLEIVQLFATDIEALNTAFAAAWYKLTTRDVGPVTRCVGPLVPPAQPFQNPLPASSGSRENWKQVQNHIQKLITGDKKDKLDPDMAGSTPYYGALFSELAWRCASTFRATDFTGGCNGAQIRFPPQKDWPVNVAMDKVMAVLAPVRERFPKLTWADLIVLAGQTANEDAGGKKTKFCGGRVDAADGGGSGMQVLAPRQINNVIVKVMDDAVVAGLTVRESVALAGRLRSPTQQMRLGYSGSYNNADASHLSNEYFVKLLTHNWAAHKSASGMDEYMATGKDGMVMYMTPSDLAIKVEPQMLAVAQEYASDNAKFRADFAAAWAKVMNADMFDGPAGNVCDHE